MVKTVFLDEAARLLGVSRRTVYYRIREGKLRTIRTACRTQRVVVDSIEALLRAELRLSGQLDPAAARDAIDHAIDHAIDLRDAAR